MQPGLGRAVLHVLRVEQTPGQVSQWKENELGTEDLHLNWLKPQLTLSTPVPHHMTLGSMATWNQPPHVSPSSFCSCLVYTSAKITLQPTFIKSCIIYAAYSSSVEQHLV